MMTTGAMGQVQDELLVVTISREEYNTLLEAQAFLNALKAAGVTSWGGYNQAKDIMARDAE